MGLQRAKTKPARSRREIGPTPELGTRWDAMPRRAAASMTDARMYSRDHGERFRRELLEFLRIPSLSGNPARAGDVRRAAEWLADHMHALGLKSARVMETAGHPVVYAD